MNMLVIYFNHLHRLINNMINTITLRLLKAATFPASWYPSDSQPITTSETSKKEDIKYYWLLVSSVDDDPIYMLVCSNSDM